MVLKKIFIVLQKINAGEATISDLTTLLPSPQKFVIIVKTNLATILTCTILVATLVVGLIQLHTAPAKVEKALCPPGSTTVHGPRFLSLRDGSEVIMQDGTRLCYSQLRKLALQHGSAYFEIETDAEHPFMILLPGGAIAEIRGTGLAVTVNEDLHTIDIAVTHGTVFVHYNGELHEIPPSQQISIDLLAKTSEITPFDASAYSWYPFMKFENATLETFAQAIQQRFHVVVEFENEALKQVPITATFENGGVRLRHIVRVMNTLLAEPGIKLDLKGTTLKICKKR